MIKRPRNWIVRRGEERHEKIIDAGEHNLGRVIAIGPPGSETAFEAIAADGTDLGRHPTEYMAVAELLAHFTVVENVKTWASE